MADRRDDEFYVGYLPRAPRRIAARTRAAVVVAVGLAVAVGVLLVSSQSPFGPGVFEFGVRTELAGIVQARPVPTLLVPRPGRVLDAPAFSSYTLVAAGKAGAADLVAAFDEQAVALAGSLVYRDGRTMVEVVEGSIEPLPPDEAARLLAIPRPSAQDLGEQTLVGEIVDSKCFLGVMKPGNLKPHRSCAARCISGGVPPVLLVRDEGGRAQTFLLVSRRGESVNADVLHLVAEPVSITGRVVRLGDLLVLQADPASYRRAS